MLAHHRPRRRSGRYTQNSIEHLVEHLVGCSLRRAPRRSLRSRGFPEVSPRPRGAARRDAAGRAQRTTVCSTKCSAKFRQRPTRCSNRCSTRLLLPRSGPLFAAQSAKGPGVLLARYRPRRVPPRPETSGRPRGKPSGSLLSRSLTRGRISSPRTDRESTTSKTTRLDDPVARSSTYRCHTRSRTSAPANGPGIDHE